MPEKCDDSMCKNQAVSHVSWGPAKEQSGNLCKHCIEKLWAKVKPLVDSGKLWWVQTRVK